MKAMHLVAAFLVAACSLASPALAADIFANQPPTVQQSPAVNGAAITPNDSTPLTQPTRMIYVGGAGDVTVVLLGDSAAITLKAVPIGTVLQVRASVVKATATTATNLVALW